MTELIGSRVDVRVIAGKMPRVPKLRHSCGSPVPKYFEQNDRFKMLLILASCLVVDRLPSYLAAVRVVGIRSRDASDIVKYRFVW